MRRWMFIAALGAALLSTPLWAQRGGGGGHGGMSMGGGHGFSGGSVGAYHGGGSAYHGSVGYGGAYRGSVGYGGSYRGTVGYGSAYRGSTYGYRGNSYWGGTRGWNGSSWNGGWHGNGWRGYPYRPGWGWRGYPWWGFGYAGWGYPFWGAGWYGGLGWYDSSYYADDSYTAQSYPSYVYVNPGSSDYSQTYQVQQDEIDRLNNEVDRLRASGPPPAQSSQPQGKTIEIHSETVLVYRDGHTEEVNNYAIVGKTIWVFNEQRAKKIPIADLDLSATKRDNEDRGIDFVVPNSAK